MRHPARTPWQRLVAVAGLCLVPSTPLQAEGRTIELGASLVGLSVTDYGGLTTTFVGVPATLYASFFVTRRLMLEPQVGFHSMTAGSRSDRLLIGTLQAGFLFRGARRASPYLLVDATAAENSYGPDQTNLALGGGAGYRLPIGALAIRGELKYRRYLRPGADALSVILAVGYVP